MLTEDVKKMKILSIGNSFSQDAHNYIHRLAEYNGFNVETVNLYIGGCTLEHHIDCLKSGSAEYDLEINGGQGIRKVSLTEGIKTDKFDIITLQQASPFSGKPQTYFPYLKMLIDFCREKQPNAEILFHKTWAYETDFTNAAFDNYARDQKEMYRRLTDCGEMVEKIYNLPLIHVGTVIQKLRDTVPEFDYGNGGISLCRDGFHLTLDYGRLAAACTWLRFILKKPINLNGFGDFDSKLTDKIVQIIEETVSENKAALPL